MIIPSEARKCPYCRTEFGEPSLSDDLNRLGYVGYPSVILTILLLLHTCSETIRIENHEVLSEKESDSTSSKRGGINTPA